MKYLLIISISLASVFNVFAQKDLEPLKIFINPGHGGHDPDDRNIVIYPFTQGDPNGYYESKSNLAKGLFLRDYLQAQGATVYMSRVTNTSADDLPLSVISDMANENDVDLFYSIHSNAHNGMVNYPLMLFKGTDDNPAKPGDKVAATINWDNFYSQKISTWTYQTRNVRGDWSFYGNTSGLGVLRGLTVEGFLSEGSFHDYIPETYRLMSPYYNKLEAWHFMKTIYEYFEKGEMSTGNIAGDIRDSRNTLQTSYYRVPNSQDNLVPIHNAKVTLTPGDVVVTTDDMYNGLYLFDELTPGDYQMLIEADGYYPQTVNVSVAKHATTYERIKLNKVRDTAPEVLSYTPNVSETDSVEASSNITVTFNWDMDEEATKQAFSITPHVDGTIKFIDSNQTLVFTPNDVLDKSTEYTVKIDKSAKHPADIEMGTDFSFKFTTKNRNRLALVLGYPNAGNETIGTKPNFRYIFDKTLNTNTILTGVTVVDKEGNTLSKAPRSVSNNKAVEGYGSTYFDLSKELAENDSYQVIIHQSLQDVNSLILADSIVIDFKTNSPKVEDQPIVNDFEGTALYQYIASESSDVTSASSSRSATQKLFGSYSHAFTYTLDELDGGEVVYQTETPEIVVSSANKMGVHVYGDFSANDLVLTFVDESATSYDVELGTLDFVGWQFKEADLKDLPASGTLKFSGFKVKGTNSILSKTGTFYVDNLLLYNESVGIEDNQNFAQARVYPNPASDFVVVTLPDSEQLVGLDLFALNGKHIQSTDNNEMRLENVTTGTYVLRVITKDKVRAYTLIVNK